MSEPSYSKGAVDRAGRHLAARLRELRAGARTVLVDEDDAGDSAARDAIEWWRDQHVAPMVEVARVVRDHAPRLERADFSAQVVTSRAKQFRTTIEKLEREPGKLTDMADIGGVRAVVSTQEEVDRLAALLGSHLEVRRVRDWARHPRPTGYRALHLHVRRRQRMVEVQLRTFGQDGWANLVEEETLFSGHDYKSGQGRAEVLALLRAIADSWAALELGEANPDLGPRLATAYKRARGHVASPTLKGIA